MSIAFIADFHLGDPTHDYFGSRRDEAFAIVDSVCDNLIEEGAEALVIAGDLFESRKPQPWAYLAATRLRDFCRKRRIRIIVIEGNHDRAVHGIGPCEVVFDDAELLRVPTLLDVCGVALNVVPWMPRSVIGSFAGSSFVPDAAAAGAILGELFTEDVLSVTHYTFAGATFDSGVQPELGGNEVVVPMPKRGRIISGHIHKQQHVGCVKYVGALTRHDFGSEKHKPSMLILRGDEWSFAPVKGAQRFVSVNVGYPLDADLNGAIVRHIGGPFPRGEETAKMLADLRAEAYEMGALHVAKPAITYARVEQTRRASVTTETSPEDALREYAEVVGGDVAARADALVELHREVAS